MQLVEIPIEIPPREFMCFMANRKPNFVRIRDIRHAITTDSGALCVVFDGGHVLIKEPDEIATAIKNLELL